ncbi:NAD(P)/FAD-dependent oxidoreductase [Pontibacter sp. G13]|uniref:flavin-containing monooxygenase n=1 Tax=Pontibacter sp. G13 TaxID=3074898 RepID=UPI00288B9877|nr:NAD(P)/FAD-dependent oxidoreductase [Pontibacter sp. G13]WNJ17969.1 NAD(P)/FAD-dependent oxidoreductase [Pontibacter sp. G13]
MKDTSPVLIVGAGPAGLAIAGRLHQRGIPSLILEQSQHVANAWRNHYDRVHLHTVKQYSHLPHAPFPDHFPQYIPKAQLVSYYDQYVASRNLDIRFGVEVQAIERVGEGWVAKTHDGEVFRSQEIAICTGFNRVINRPKWANEWNFHGEVIHSREYRNGLKYRGRRVLVVGMGNTGAELAIDLVEAGADVYLSVRGPVNIVLRDVLGRPTQKTAMMLNKLPTAIGDWLGRKLSKWTVGDLSKYGLERSHLAPGEQLRKFGKTPVIDVGTIKLIKQGKIKIVPGVEQFYSDGVQFTNESTTAFDAVILATGYRPAVQEFLQPQEGIYNSLGVPKAPVLDAYPGLYFCGFDAYASGILNSIHRDSETVVNEIAARQGVQSQATPNA